MFLEYWQLAILAVLFGFCAVWNRISGLVNGQKYGTLLILKQLSDRKIIAVTGNTIIPYPTNQYYVDPDEYPEDTLAKLKKDIDDLLNGIEQEENKRKDQNK
jgi:hypothetical protein